MRVLDLFCGGGGAAEGYARAGWEVIGVDIDPQPSYPYEFHQADALSVLQLTMQPFLRGDYQLIHASPPCQPYSRAVTSRSSKWNDTLGKDEPALIEPLRELLRATGLPYVIENVMHAPLDGFVLCGSMFGLDIPRHRRIESNVPMTPPGHPECRGIAKRAAERRGWDYRDMTVTGKGRRAGWSDRAAELLGITHPMRQHDLKEAIPPGLYRMDRDTAPEQAAMSLCACGHDFTDHYQTDVEYLCILCSWCDGYTKAAANNSATAPVPAGGTPEGLAREKVEMTDSEVKPSSPTTEAAGWEMNTPDDTAIVFLEDYAGRLPLDVYEDLQADIAQLVKDEREWVQQAREGGYHSGLLEGRREAVRDLEALSADLVNDHRGIPYDVIERIDRVAGLNASEPQDFARLREALRSIIVRCEEGDQQTDWLPIIADIARTALAGVAGLEGEGRSPIGSNASESPPTHQHLYDVELVAPYAEDPGKIVALKCACGDIIEPWDASESGQGED